MTLAAILIGILNCIILAVILVLIGAVCQWVLAALGWPVPQQVARLFLAVVALITLVCFVSLLVGAPMFHLIHVSGLPAVAAA